MPESLQSAAEQVRLAARALKQSRPMYAAIIDFYEAVFVAQEESVSQIKIDPVPVSKRLRDCGAAEDFPLIKLRDFAIDADSAGTLLKKICEIVLERSKDLKSAAAAVIRAVADGTLKPDDLFDGLLRGDDPLFEKTAAALGIATEALAFITYSSIKPSLTVGAGQLAACPAPEKTWAKGYCPICGSSPGLSLLAGQGSRLLVCSFCWHQWPARRSFCPFCNTGDNNALHYVFSEKEKEYRADVCEKCKTYLKSIDLRETDRVVYPPLEQVTTLHLDIKARDLGYKSAIDLVLPEK